MQNILKEISTLDIKLATPNCLLTDEQKQLGWLGNPPCSLAEIELAEKRLGVNLPHDYKHFLTICNGFSTVNDSIEPNFEPASEVDFLRNIDPFLIEIWSEGPLAETGHELAKSILVAGANDEQCFLLIPPINGSHAWKYWKFASWIPGQQAYDSLTEYFEYVLSFLKKEVEE